MRFRDLGALQPSVTDRYLGSRTQPMTVTERARRMNEGPNFRMPEIGDSEPPPTMTMRRLSETIQRHPDDLDAVSTAIPGGAVGAIAELERQAHEMRALREREKAELETEPHEESEQAAQRLFLQSMLIDDPGLVLEMVIEFMKSKQQ